MNGMTTTVFSEKNWSADDICRILEASAKAGVRTLKFAGLDVEFESAGVTNPNGAPAHYIAPPTAEIAEPNHVAQDRESRLMDELKMREDQIEELLLSDPVEAERLIAQGELAEDERRPEYGEEA